MPARYFPCCFACFRGRFTAGTHAIAIAVPACAGKASGDEPGALPNMWAATGHHHRPAPRMHYQWSSGQGRETGRHPVIFSTPFNGC